MVTCNILYRVKNITFLLLGLILTTTQLSAYQAEVQNISSEKYFDATLKEISEAKSSIIVAMYLVSSLPDQPNSQPNQLLDALINAKNRGVIVKVILDQNINFETESSEDAVASNKNQRAYEYLRKNNVPVFFDTSAIYTHSKAIIIDDETVILGSTNWSKAALTRNNEASALIRSEEFAQSLLMDLNKIEIQENIPASLTPSVPIPKYFLTKKTLLGEMATRSDERAFDTYLYLLKEFNGNEQNKLTLDYDNVAKSLGIDNMSKEDYRRQINKVLLKLKDKYRLIEFQKPGRNQDTEIRLLNRQVNAEDSINLPTTYWRYGWNKTLSFPSKILYLVYSLYTQALPSGRFSISREKLSKSHGISASFISDGNQSLRKLNLLDIEYGDLEDMKFGKRQANTYTLMEFYNPEDLMKDLDKLVRKYGKEKFDRAVKTASLVFEENNQKTIEALINLEDKYGQPVTEEASRKISEKSGDNPKRSAGYLINTIKAIGNQKST